MLPLTRPWMGEAEAAAAAEAIRRSVTGGGTCGREAEEALGGYLHGARPLLMNSCTSALEAAVSLAGIGAGDEVVLPSFTFVSCANAVVRAGARPVFADIDPETLNIDPAAVAAAITSRTRAIIVVHYAGRACDMERILEIAHRAGLIVIEDAAHALGATWQGRPLGTIGDYGCFSFHGTKDVVCGEGGALICSREDDRLRAEVVREKGTDRESFLRGDVDKYSWVGTGSSYVLSDVLAAILRVQLSRLPAILARKRALAGRLTAALLPIADRVVLPREWPGIESSWHLYPILVPESSRDQVLSALRAENIGAAFHYVPLHDSPYARSRYGTAAGRLPVTEAVSASLVRLPLFAAMSDDDLADVAAAALKAIEAIVAPDSNCWIQNQVGLASPAAESSPRPTPASDPV
jgi:dTDP-4-amino-4,6-dideoxygalactose transaminase